MAATADNNIMNWLYLLLAGCCEIAWAVALKYSHNWTRITPSALTIVGMIASVGLLTLAIRTIPIGTAYAVWTGIGAVGTIIAGSILFGASYDLVKIFFLAMIVIGIVGVNLSD